MKKFFKVTGLILLGFLVIILITAAFVKKSYTVERSITLNQPKQVVYDYVKYLKNQDEFSVWAKIDPNMKMEYRGTDGTVGFVSAWASPVKEAGKGEQEIIKMEEEKRIDYELRFIEPMKSTNYAYMLFDGVSDSTTNVSWGFSGKMKYPMNTLLIFIDMENMLGKDLDGGLHNLKAVLEQ